MRVFTFLFLLALVSCQNPDSEDNAQQGSTSTNDPVEKEVESSTANDSQQEETVDPNPIYRLETMFAFDSIESVSIRNNNGLRELTVEEWEELEFAIMQATYVYGLICKPVDLALIFKMKDKSEIEGYFCSGFINFVDKDLNGSFRLGRVIDLQSY